MSGLTDELVNDLVAGAAELGAELVGLSEDHVNATLTEVQQNLCDLLSPQLGKKVAEIVVRAFGRAVKGHRAELQAAGFHHYGDALQ
jgi:hypothetical protein